VRPALVEFDVIDFCIDLSNGESMRTMKTVRTRHAAAVIAMSAVLAGCAGSENQTSDSAGGNIAERVARTDTGLANSTTPIAGGTAQITPTDAKSVEHATEYKLTETNFRQFLAASDSLAALRARDPQVRAMFDKQVNDAGTVTRVEETNAGRKRMEEYYPVSQAITSTGMSVKDYFVAAIAIAQAERFMGDPKSAPPTPALPGNAEFLRAHQAELSRLRAHERGQ
jgi:hypothetical protein